METDARVQRAIRNVSSDVTIITIAHRLQTIMDADRVYVMHEGRVAEYDSPTTLLRDPASMFSALASVHTIRSFFGVPRTAHVFDSGQLFVRICIKSI